VEGNQFFPSIISSN